MHEALNFILAQRERKRGREGGRERRLFSTWFWRFNGTALALPYSDEDPLLCHIVTDGNGRNMYESKEPHLKTGRQRVGSTRPAFHNNPLLEASTPN